MKVLDQLLEGISPKEKTFHEDAAYTGALHHLSEQDTLLRATLNQEQEELLNAMQKEEAALSAANRQNMFRYGFSMGAKLMLELLESSQ